MSASTTAGSESISELLTLPQAAALCGVSQRTLWGWAADGTSPRPLKIGKGTVRYSRRAYQDWIASGCPRCALLASSDVAPGA